MHPYRVPARLAPEPPGGAEPAGLPFYVLALVSAIQVATALPAHGLWAGQTLLGLALLGASVRWLAAHRRRR